MKTPSIAFSRRDLILGGACAASAAALPLVAQARKQSLPFVDLRETPASLTAYAGLESSRDLTHSGGEWSSGDLVVALDNAQAGVIVSLVAPSLALTHLRLRWQMPHPEDILVLGDAWERSY